MSFALIGVNHKHAQIEAREKLALEKEELQEAFSYLLRQEDIAECFLLSTCNRTELYAVCPEKHKLQKHFLNLFDKEKNLDSSFLRLCYQKDEEDAIKHLFRVACGMDSMVLGETQVLGQLKEAYYQCKASGTTGVYVHSICEKALSTGKKVHTQTSLGKHAVSFGYAAVELARKVFSSLSDYTLMVIGTGEMAKLTLQNLFDLGAKEVIVASRHRDRGEAVAARFRGKFISTAGLDQGLAKADVVICATVAPHYVITRERLDLLQQQRGRRPLLIIDLAIPRNVEPAVSSLEDIYLYNLDDLKSIIEENQVARQKEAEKAEVIIGEQVADFTLWLRRQQVIPVMSSLRHHVETIRQEKLQQFAGRFSALSDKERQIIDKFSRSLVNGLIKNSITNIKDLSSQGDFESIEPYAYLLLGLEKEDKN